MISKSIQESFGFPLPLLCKKHCSYRFDAAVVTYYPVSMPKLFCGGLKLLENAPCNFFWDNE